MNNITLKERVMKLIMKLLKGMGFSLYERQYLGLHGLLPPAFMTQEQQAYRVITKLREQPNDLARYIQLDGLQVFQLFHSTFRKYFSLPELNS